MQSNEIASRGYWPRGGVKGMLPHPQELREELQRAREALEAAGSNRIVGYRHPRWIMRRCASSTESPGRMMIAVTRWKSVKTSSAGSSRVTVSGSRCVGWA